MVFKSGDWWCSCNMYNTDRAANSIILYRSHTRHCHVLAYIRSRIIMCIYVYKGCVNIPISLKPVPRTRPQSVRMWIESSRNRRVELANILKRNTFRRIYRDQKLFMCTVADRLLYALWMRGGGLQNWRFESDYTEIRVNRRWRRYTSL